MRRPWPGPALVLLAGLGLYAGLAVGSLRRLSATFDEPAHLTAGYTYLRLGDFRLNPEHPPLVKVLAAAPLLALGPELRTDNEAWALRRQWELARRFLYRWNDADELLFRGRLAVVGLGMGLAAAVFLWTRGRWGPWAAGLALGLCVLSPEVLAHGALVTTDVGIALFFFLAVVSFDAALRRGGTWRPLACGLALGAALATKFSAVLLAPVLGSLAVLHLLAGEGDPRRRAAALARVLLAMAVLAPAVLWASYGFHASLSPDPAVEAAIDWRGVTPAPPAAAGVARLVRRAGVLPEAFVYGFLRFLRHSEARPAFLLGQVSPTGWWYYFPATLALKTPLALFALLAIAQATRRRHTPRWREELVLWAPVVVYLGFSMARGLNIGHRHLLPLAPFLFAAAGRAALWARDSRGWARPALVGLLGAWYASAALSVHPHHLAYFNELAGGPARAYRLLVDSNLDWGQALPALREHLERTGAGPVKLSYFGTAPPEHHRIAGRLLPGHALPPPRDVVWEVRPGDLLAVSATNLQGLYVDPGALPLMETLRSRRPLAAPGYAILVYRADFAWSGAPAPEPLRDPSPR